VAIRVEGSRRLPERGDRSVELLEAIWRQGIEHSIYLAAIRRRAGVCAVILVLALVLDIVARFTALVGVR
jgi:hypothetical protein